METTPLFRPEAIKAQGEGLLGVVQIARRPYFNLLALFAICSALALGLFVAYGELTRKSTLPGLVVPAEGTINIAAPQPGTVTTVHKNEGAHTSVKTDLFTLRVDRSTGRGELSALVETSLHQRKNSLTSERRLAELQNRQKDEALAERFRSVEVQIAGALDELKHLDRRVQLAEQTIHRVNALVEQGYMSDLHAQQRQEELLEVQGRYSAMQRTIAGLTNDARALQSERATNRSALELQLQQFSRAVAGLEQELSENGARREIVVKASVGGTVSAVNVVVGQFVNAGQTLATIVPMMEQGGRAPVRVELYGPSKAIGFVQPGQRVWLRFDAFPYQKHGMGRGRVERVSITPIAAQDLPIGQSQALMGAAQTTEPLYRIQISVESGLEVLGGHSADLRAGMTLRAEVVLDRLKIWEWILGPLKAATGWSRINIPRE